MNRINGIARRGWLYIFLLLAISYAVHYSFGQAGRLEQPLHFSRPFGIVVIAVQLLFWLTYSMLWKRLLVRVSATNFTLWECFRQQNLLTLGKYLPGKIWGMVARGATLAENGVTVAGAVVATCTEQTLVLHSAILVSAILFASLQPSLPTAALAIVSILTLAFGAQLLRIAFRLYLRMAKPGAEIMSAQKIELISSTTYLKFAFGHSVGWIINGLLFASIYHTFFGAAPSIQLLGILMLANTVGVTLGFLAIFSPGGIGVREAVTSGVLTLVMPLSDAVMLAVLFRLWLLLTDIVVGGLVVVGNRKKLP